MSGRVRQIKGKTNVKKKGRNSICDDSNGPPEMTKGKWEGSNDEKCQNKKEK